MKKKPKLIPANEIPGLADECWVAYVNREITHEVARKLAAIPDFDKQKRALAMTCEMAAKRLSVLPEKLSAARVNQRACPGMATTAKANNEISSGNVFADLGVANPEEAMTKAQLARVICLLVEKEGLTQKAVAQRLGIDQPKVSALLRGRLKDFSTDRLMQYVNRLGHNVRIDVQSRRAKTPVGSTAVALV